MSEKLHRLIAALQNPYVPTKDESEEFIEVSRPASSAAVLYERVRTAVDYQEEHLLRRNAILRIVKRLLGSDMDTSAMARALLQELIWARYLPNKEVPESFAKKLVPIFDKYDELLVAAEQVDHRKEEFYLWVLDLMSTEIEYALTPPYAEEALASYMYEEMRERITWDPAIVLDEQQRDLLLYIAIHQVLLKSNRATLRFRVFTLYHPDWPGASNPEQITEVKKRLEEIVDMIDDHINHPVTSKLSLLLRRKAGVFRVVRDLVEEEPGAFPELLSDPDAIDRRVKKALKSRTNDFKVRLRRTVVRAVMFLFITKMLLALLVEVPYDLLVFKHINYASLGVNIGFHPIFLAIIGLTVTVKEKANTQDYQQAVRALIVGADHASLNLRMKRSIFSKWSTIFYIVYVITYTVTFGAIATLLTQAGFKWISTALFLFFFSLVTFFGIRVRSSVKEIVLSDSRSGWFGTLFDFFMLPVVRAGRWLSLKFSKINVFIYFFDFIVEAPVKVALRFFENWITFVREKKEEI